MKTSIIFLILIILLSGCVGVEKETKSIRTYIYNFTDPNFINHTTTLKLYSNDTFSFSDLNHWCNCGSTVTGNFTETETNVTIKYVTPSTFQKNGSDLIDWEGHKWKRV